MNKNLMKTGKSMFLKFIRDSTIIEKYRPKFTALTVYYRKKRGPLWKNKRFTEPVFMYWDF